MEQLKGQFVNSHVRLQSKKGYLNWVIHFKTFERYSDNPGNKKMILVLGLSWMYTSTASCIYILKLNSSFCVASHVCKYPETIDLLPWHSLLNNCIPLRGQLAELKCCAYEFQIMLERGGRHHFHKWSASPTQPPHPPPPSLAHTRPFTPSRSEWSWREHYRICLNSSPSTWHQWAVQISSDLFCMALHITAISPVLLPRERFAQY